MSAANSHFVDEDKVKLGMTVTQMIKRLWPYARRFPVSLAISILSMFSLALFSRLLPWIFGRAIDDGIMKHDESVITHFAVLYLLVEILRSLSDFSYQYFFQRYGQRVLTLIRQDLMVRTQHLPIDYFNKNPVGRIVTRLTNDTSTLSEVFSSGVVQIATESVVFVSIIIAMALISLKLTVVTLFTAPLFLFLSFKVAGALRMVLRDTKKKLATLSSYASEQLSGIRVVQLYNQQYRSLSQFVRLSREYREANLISIRQYALLQPLMNLFNGMTLTAALAYGGYLSLENALPVGAFVAFLMHAQDLISPLREILEKFQQFQNSLTSAERVFQSLDELPEAAESEIRPLHIGGRITLKNLSFRYHANLPFVLKNISVDIQPGRKVALVGRTGSGKSSLVGLLQRFYEPPQDSIFIDGMAIESLPLRSLRRRIGVVQQDPFLFRGTIEENLRLGQDQFTRPQLQQALDRIGYGEFLRQTGRGLDSRVEERGANLSSGERQLLSFARILVFEPDVLILDEATAHVDSQTEILIQKATEAVTEGRTSLIVAHRLSTIEKSDEILVLEQGELKERGNHQELLAARGLYYQVASIGLKSTTI